MQNKRGLSAVVTTLIIILLVIVAVGILWAVVSSFIKSSSEQIELGQFTLDLEIKSVQVAGDDVTVTVQVKRNRGEGDFIGMNFIFSDEKNSETFREDTFLGELDTGTFTFILTELNAAELTSVSVAPIYQLSSGKEKAGDAADMYDFGTGVSVSDGDDGGTGTGDVVLTNFEAMGFVGTEKIEYDSISGKVDENGDPELPEFKKAIVDPLDVLPGDSQTFTAHVYSPHGISEVTSITELDNSISDLDFEKIDEYTENEQIIEIWSVTWTVEDVHAIKYRTNLTAIDNEGNSNSLGLTWTDSCQSQITQGIDDEIVSTCATAVSGTNVWGLDDGSLIISADMTIRATTAWVFNDGKTITPNANLIVQGTIQKSNLYTDDDDGDGYIETEGFSLTGTTRAKDVLDYGVFDCDDTSAYVQLDRTVPIDADHDGHTDGGSATRCTGPDTPINGRDYYNDATNNYKYLKSTPLGSSDCDDDDDQVWGVGYTCYADVDGDGFGAGSGDAQCGSCSEGYVEDNTDCCDTDANARPNQGTSYSVPRSGGCGGSYPYDYNCNNVETKSYTLTGGSCDDCEANYELERCDYFSTGDTGYSGSVPACGVAGNWILSSGGGEECSREYSDCGSVIGCTSEQRTQKCI